MNYTELTANVEDICENEFTAAQMAMFTDQAEQKIYNSVQIPALRKSGADTLTSGVSSLAAPSDFLHAYSISVTISNVTSFLLNKDVNFIREAFPNSTVTGVPTHYAMDSSTTFLIGPTPDDT